jgi:tetratricopeptide (TPR) repeat protein
VHSRLVGSHGHSKLGGGAVEQLVLFEDKYILLNRGISALISLDLHEAKNLLQRYQEIYRDNVAVDGKLNIAHFLIHGFESVPDSDPDEPACLYRLWRSFEEYLKSVGMESDTIIPAMKDSFFHRIIDAIDRYDLSGSLCLCDTVPMGYVYLQAGRYDRAVQSLQAALLAVPDNGALYGYLGDAYMCKGEVDVARRCYLEACLIDPNAIDWDHMKDAELAALRTRLIETADTKGSSAVGWLPCHAYINGLFKPKKIRLKEELKRFVEGYLNLRKEYAKGRTPEHAPKLFITAIILCHNKAALNLIKGIDFIEIRKHMKEINPALFYSYMKYLERNR